MILLYKHIKVDIPYNGLQIEDFRLIGRINDHIYLSLEVLIDEENIYDYINQDISDKTVRVEHINGIKMFVGKITDVDIIYQNDIYIMRLNSVSYTKNFDIKKNSRTFCNLDMTYSDVIKEVLDSYSKKSYIDTITNRKVIDDFLLQYEETDWQFLKRLATHFNSVLVADYSEDFGRVYFGLPGFKSRKNLTLNDYRIIRNIDSYKRNEAHGVDDLLISDYTKWEIISKEYLMLGEEVIFNNINCVVSEIKIEIYNDELVNIYILSIKKGIKTAYKNNEKIYGMSIPATVMEVKGNIMKVHFDIDPVYKSYSNERYFTYALESSSWYCMPETGSEVHIYFPSNYESEAIAIHALRKTKSGAQYASKTQNPDNKSFSHTSGSELQLTPSNISFTSDSGQASSIVLSQSGDINIHGTNINFKTIDCELGIRNGADGIEALKPQYIYIFQLLRI